MGHDEWSGWFGYSPPINQCDGCRRRLPVKDGMHDLTGEVGCYPGEKMWCTRDRYIAANNEGKTSVD